MNPYCYACEGNLSVSVCWRLWGSKATVRRMSSQIKKDIYEDKGEVKDYNKILTWYVGFSQIGYKSGPASPTLSLLRWNKEM